MQTIRRNIAHTISHKIPLICTLPGFQLLATLFRKYFNEINNLGMFSVNLFTRNII